MPFERHDEHERTALELTGALSVCEVAALHAELLTQVASKRRIVICLSHVTECDTAGIQLLCAVYKTAAEGDVELSMAGHSPAIRQAADRAGLALRGDLGLDEEN